MKKRVFIDYDNTMVDTTTAIYDTVWQIYGRSLQGVPKPTAKDINVYGVETWLKQQGLDKKINLSTLYTLFGSPVFFEKLKPYKGAQEMVSTLISYGYEVVITTHTHEAVLIDKIAHINKYFPDVKIQPILNQYFKYKDIIDMSGCVFIDDRADILDESNATFKICFIANNVTMDINDYWRGLTLTKWEPQAIKTICKLCQK